MAVSQTEMPRAKYQSFININELIFDIVMLVFVLILNRYFGPDQIKHTLSPMMISTVYLIFAYCLPWYMGIIYRQFEGYLRQTGRRVLLSIFGMLVLFIFISITYWLMQADTMDSNQGGFMIIAGIVLLMMGCIMGGAYNPLLELEAENSEEISTAGIISLFTLTLLGFFYCGVNYSDFSERMHWGSVLNTLIPISMFLGIAVVFIILLTALMYLKKGLIDLKLLKPLMKLKHFLLPFLLTTLLLLFNNLNLQVIKEMVHSITGSSSGMAVLIGLIISGVLPFRIMLMLTPPVRYFNIGIGIIVLYFYIR